MTRPIPLARRVACALAAVALAGIAFRAQLADAVVTRGDDALRFGDAQAALRAYERALWLDPRSHVAADRLAFHLAVHHTPDAARRAIAVASAALAARPDDAALLADRALAEMQLQDWSAARRDFASAAQFGGDGRYARFARLMARRTVQ